MAKGKSKYPFTKFQVTPLFNIKEIVLVGPAMQRGWGIGGREYERTGYATDAKGKAHYLCPLFDTRELALTYAERAIAEQEARHKTAGENIAKRKANLAKAKEAK